MSQSKIFECQVATVVIQSSTETGDGERLARCSSDQKVDWLIFVVLNGCEIAVQRHVRKAVR